MFGEEDANAATAWCSLTAEFMLGNSKLQHNTQATAEMGCDMARPRSYDLNTILHYQQRQYAWHYWSQRIGIIVTLAAALFALMNAVLSWLPVSWLIVVVAFCSAFAQIIQTLLQVRLNPPQRDPADELIRSMTKKQES